MRATRAYIASAGTAAVMLGAALSMLVLVSALVAFGAWPGESSGKQVDQVLLGEVVRAKPHPVAVGSQAIKVARAVERRQAAQARKRGGRGRTTRGGDTLATTPAGTVAPNGSANPVAAAPGGDKGGGGSSPAESVRQQTQNATQNVTQNLDNTTQQVTDKVQNQTDQTTTQVNQVVDQVVGGVQQQTQPTVQQVQGTVDQTTGTVTNTVGTTTGTVKDTAGSLLGH